MRRRRRRVRKRRAAEADLAVVCMLVATTLLVMLLLLLAAPTADDTQSCTAERAGKSRFVGMMIELASWGTGGTGVDADACIAARNTSRDTAGNRESCPREPHANAGAGWRRQQREQPRRVHGGRAGAEQNDKTMKNPTAPTRTRLTIAIAAALTPAQRKDLTDQLLETTEDRLATAEESEGAKVRVRIERQTQPWYPRQPGDTAADEPQACTATVTISKELAESDIDELRRDLIEAADTWLAANVANGTTARP